MSANTSFTPRKNRIRIDALRPLAILCLSLLAACSTIGTRDAPDAPTSPGATEPLASSENSNRNEGGARTQSQGSGSSGFQRLASPIDYPFIAVYFGSEEQSGLHLAASFDGYAWTEITDLYAVDFNPRIGTWAKFRDPSLDRGPDGTFHMTWTCGGEGFCHARSRDLINWTEEKFIRVDRGPLATPPAIMTWAPDVFFDEARNEFIISFAAANKNVPGLQTKYKGNFKAYYVLTQDFATFTEPALLLQPHPDMFVIDPALIKSDGKYYAFVKIESANTIDGGKDGIHYAKADALEGPWSKLSGTRLPNNRVNSEGGAPLKVGESYIVYYDRPGALQAARTRNFRSWKDISHKLTAPANYRHGTMRQINPAPAADDQRRLF